MNDCTYIPVELQTFYKWLHIPICKPTNILEKLYTHVCGLTKIWEKLGFIPLNFSLEDTAPDIYIFRQCAYDEGAAEVALLSREVNEVLSMKVNQILQYLWRHINYPQAVL
jgi:hypothetical protein